MDIEFYSHHQFKGETIPGMEPQQRFPDSRPNSNFGGRDNRGAGNDNFSRDRKLGGGARAGGFGASRGGFADRNVGGAPEGFSYERKGGFNDRFAGARNDGPAPRGDFAARKPAFGKPMGVKPGNGGKVFVPRDAKKRPARSA